MCECDVASSEGKNNGDGPRCAVAQLFDRSSDVCALGIDRVLVVRRSVHDRVW